MYRSANLYRNATMHRSATEIKIAQLEKRVAFLESLLKPALTNFKQGLKDAVKAIGGDIVKFDEDIKNRSGKESHNFLVLFSLPAQTEFSREPVNTWKFTASFEDDSEDRGNFNISVGIALYFKDGVARHSKSDDMSLASLYGAKGVKEKLHRELPKFLNTSILFLEKK